MATNQLLAHPHLARIPATDDGYADFPLAGPSADSKKIRVGFGDQAYFDHQVRGTQRDGRH